LFWKTVRIHGGGSVDGGGGDYVDDDVDYCSTNI
jgi:hypothetical protein